MTEPVSESAGSAPTRRAVLDLLKRNGEQTVAQLGAALGVSGVAVRRHLEVLEHVGLVQQTLGAAPSELGRGAVERLFAHRQHELAELYAGRTKGRPLPELARALA